MINLQSPIIETIGSPPPAQKRRFNLLIVCILLIISIFLGRSFYLQVLQGSQYRVSAEGNRISVLPIPAPRGVIYDSRSNQLVENIASTDLVLDPSALPAQGNDFDIIKTIPDIMPFISEEDVVTALNQTREDMRVTLLAKAIDHDTMLAIEESGLSSQGIHLVSSLTRKYIYEEAAAHILGYTGIVTAEELENNDKLTPIDVTGKLGIEKTYDNELRGKHGYSNIEVNAKGQPQKDLGKIEPVFGQDINLTLDIEFQQFIYDLFAEKEEFTGAVVVIDPTTGAVKASVSYPSFDNNIFSQPALKDSIQDFFSDESRPLFNRAVDGTYPPASTIKPFLTAAAIDAGIITPQTTFTSTGGVSVGPWFFPDWRSGGHGVTDARKAIAESVNTFYYLTIGGNDDHTGLGVGRAKDYLQIFGFGSRTGIDLASEAPGFLPSPEWKQNVKNESWYIGDTYNLSIGQGDVLTTPLQLAVGTAALANGTYWNKPYLLQDNQESTPLPLSREAIDTVRQGMRDTVVYGSGVRLSNLPIDLAGKTGTAQAGGDDTHAWFTSFGPFEEPKIAMAVLLEKAGGGDEVAVPLSQEIWEWWIENRM